MKKQDIAALIDGKIKGQGSAIDIGGALPEILGGLNENSVSEDMTETAQMQMRKELGLYYEETTEEEKQAQYDAETAYIVADYSTARLTEDLPEPEDIVDVLYDGEHVDFTVTEKKFGEFAVKVGEGLQPDMWFDVREMAQSPIFPTPGVWITITASPNPEKYTLVYKASETTISKVPEKYLPAMGDEVEGNPTVPGGTSPTPLQNVRINDDYFSIPQGGGSAPVVITNIPGPAEGQDLASPSWDAAQSFAAGDLDKLFSGEANTAIYTNISGGQTYTDTFFVTRHDMYFLGYHSVLVLWSNDGPVLGIVRSGSYDTMYVLGLNDVYADAGSGQLLGSVFGFTYALDQNYLDYIHNYFENAYRFDGGTKRILYTGSLYMLVGSSYDSTGNPYTYKATFNSSTRLWSEAIAEITIGDWS